jgi:hypothetical protein
LQNSLFKGQKLYGMMAGQAVKRLPEPTFIYASFVKKTAKACKIKDYFLARRGYNAGRRSLSGTRLGNTFTKRWAVPHSFQGSSSEESP